MHTNKSDIQCQPVWCQLTNGHQNTDNEDSFIKQFMSLILLVAPNFDILFCQVKGYQVLMAREKSKTRINYCDV